MIQIVLHASTVAEALAMRAELIAAGIPDAPSVPSIATLPLPSLSAKGEEQTLRDEYKAAHGKNFRLYKAHKEAGLTALDVLRQWKAGGDIGSDSEAPDVETTDTLPEDTGEEMF